MKTGHVIRVSTRFENDWLLCMWGGTHEAQFFPKCSSQNTVFSFIDYFMESTRVRYLRTSCWRIRKRTNERSERVSFLIQKQRVRKYRTEHFPCCNLFVYFIPTEIFQPQPDFHPPLGRTNIKLCFHSVRCKHVASSSPSVNIFRNVYLASPAFDLFPLPCSFTSFALRFQTFPCLVKLVVVEKGLRHICLL